MCRAGCDCGVCSRADTSCDGDPCRCADHENEDLQNTTWNRRYKTMREKLATREGCQFIADFYDRYPNHRISFGEKKLLEQAVARLRAESVRDEHLKLFAERGNVVSLAMHRAVKRIRGK